MTDSFVSNILAVPKTVQSLDEQTLREHLVRALHKGKDDFMGLVLELDGVDSFQMLNTLAGKGTSDDLARLHKAAQLNVFDPADWEQVYLAAALVCARETQALAVSSYKKTYLEAALKSTRETPSLAVSRYSKQTKKRSTVTAPANAVMNWIEKNKPQGYQITDELHSSTQERFARVTEADGLIQKSARQSADQLIKRAERTNFNLSDKLGLEGVALEALIDKDFKSLERISKKVQWMAYSKQQELAGRPQQLALVFEHLMNLKTKEQQQKALETLHRSHSVSAQQWDEFYSWNLTQSAVQMKGPNEYCQWLKEVQPDGFNPYSEPNKMELNKAFALAFRRRTEEKNKRSSTSLGNPERIAPKELEGWIKAGARSSQFLPEENRGLRSKLIRNALATAHLSGSVQSSQFESALRALWECIGTDHAQTEDFQSLGRELQSMYIALSRNEERYPSDREGQEGSSPSKLLKENLKGAATKIVNVLTSHCTTDVGLAGLGLLAREKHRTAAVHKIACKVALGCAAQKDMELEVGDWVGILDHLDDADVPRAKEALKLNLKKNLTWSCADIAWKSEKTVARFGTELLNGLSAKELGALLLFSCKKVPSNWNPRLIMRFISAVDGWKEALECKDSDGHDSLHWVCKMYAGAEQEGLVSELVKNGADPRASDSQGISAAHILAACGQTHVLKHLEDLVPGLLEYKENAQSASAAEISRLKGLDMTQLGLKALAPERFSFIKQEEGLKQMQEWLTKSELFQGGWGTENRPDLASFAQSIEAFKAKEGFLNGDNVSNLSLAYECLSLNERSMALELFEEILKTEYERSSNPRQLALMESAHRLDALQEAEKRWKKDYWILDKLDEGSALLRGHQSELKRLWKAQDWVKAQQLSTKMITLWNVLGMPRYSLTEISRAAGKIIAFEKEQAASDQMISSTLDDYTSWINTGTSNIDKLAVESTEKLEKNNYFDRLKVWCEHGKWDLASTELKKLRKAPDEFKAFGRLVGAKIDQMEKNAQLGEGGHMASVTTSAAWLSTAVYDETSDYLREGFRLISPTRSRTLEERQAAVCLSETGKVEGKRWEYREGVWRSGLCKAVAVSKVIDGQEVIFLSIRGTYRSLRPEEGYNSFGGNLRFMVQIASEYARIWLHAKRVKPLADALQVLAQSRGAKFVITGHSLGGAAAETLMQSMPEVDSAIIFGSPGTGILNNGKFSHRWFSKNKKDARVLSFKHANDGVPLVGALLYSKTAQTEILTSLVAPENKNLGKLGRMGTIVEAHIVNFWGALNGAADPMKKRFSDAVVVLQQLKDEGVNPLTRHFVAFVQLTRASMLAIWDSKRLLVETPFVEHGMTKYENLLKEGALSSNATHDAAAKNESIQYEMRELLPNLAEGALAELGNEFRIQKARLGSLQKGTMGRFEYVSMHYNFPVELRIGILDMMRDLDQGAYESAGCWGIHLSHLMTQGGQNGKKLEALSQFCFNCAGIEADPNTRTEWRVQKRELVRQTCAYVDKTQNKRTVEEHAQLVENFVEKTHVQEQRDRRAKRLGHPIRGR